MWNQGNWLTACAKARMNLRLVSENLLTEGAEQYLEAIHYNISEFDCVANANYALDELMDVAESLSRFPERGSYPKELVRRGIKEYRRSWKSRACSHDLFCAHFAINFHENNEK